MRKWLSDRLVDLALWLDPVGDDELVEVEAELWIVPRRAVGVACRGRAAEAVESEPAQARDVSWLAMHGHEVGL